MILYSKYFLWIASGALLITASPVKALAQGATPKPLYVGECKPGKDNYATISAAVAAAPAGATVYVCPGVYPEQVNIGQAITLQAIASGNSDSAVITIPASGLMENIYQLVPCQTGHSCSVNGYTLSYYGMAQLAVENVSGPVTISGITVDGTGAATTGGATLFAGFYFDSSTVIADGIEARNTSATPQAGIGIAAGGDGIFAADNYAKLPTVTVKDSYIYGFTYFGISSADALVATGNTLSSSANPVAGGCGGIATQNVAATLTGNLIEANFISSSAATGCLFSGIAVIAPSSRTTITGNEVVRAATGFTVVPNPENAGNEVPVSISGNDITLGMLVNGSGAVGVSTGMVLSGEQFDVAGNVINGVNGTNVSSAGMNFGCSALATSTFGQNTFRGTTTALTGVPGGMTLSAPQVYRDVQTVEQSCP